MRFLAIVAAGLRLLAICHGEEAWIPQLSRESEPTRTVCVFDQDGGHTCTQKTTCHDIETEEECGRAFYAMCIPPEASYCLWEESVCTSINERATNYTGEVVCGNIDNKKECEAQFVVNRFQPKYQRCSWLDSSECSSVGHDGKFVSSFDFDSSLGDSVCYDSLYVVENRPAICRADQFNTSDRCISKGPIDAEAQGEVFNSVFQNAVSTLALSQQIYQLHEVYRTGNDGNRSRIDLINEQPMSISEAYQLLKSNIPLLANSKTAEVQEATVLLKWYYDYVNSDPTVSEHLKSESGAAMYQLNVSKSDEEDSLVYGIVRSPKKMRVYVFFKGSTTIRFDWWKNGQILKRKLENPIRNLDNDIWVHVGFAKILLGKAGTPVGSRPIDKIFEEILPLMQRGYRLYSTGHSLGGALSTLFGFYAAANPEISKFGGGPVDILSFSSPRVGDKNFQDAFKFMEERGMVRHARFYNRGDKIPYIPKGNYYHTGIEVTLREGQPHIVNYPIEHNLGQTQRSVFEWFAALPSALIHHSCEQLIQRIQAAAEEFKGTSMGTEYRIMWGLQPAPWASADKSVWKKLSSWFWSDKSDEKGEL